MRCPACSHEEDKVLETRAVRDGAAIRRRRSCLDCGHRFTTYEYVESASIQLVKKDGRREPFQREKLYQGIAKACEKRPISRPIIDELVDRIERELFRVNRSEIQSDDIGRKVMEGLRSLDPVAYVRFASVYLNFSDLDQFVETIEHMPTTTGLDGAEPETGESKSPSKSPKRRATEDATE